MRWFHFIFDPTTDAPSRAGESSVSRYWKVLPFKKTAAGQGVFVPQLFGGRIVPGSQ